MIWKTVFHDKEANMALYDLVGGRGLQVQEDVIYFGTNETIQIGNRHHLIESFLHPILPSYRDVDITIKLEIESTAKTDGQREDTSHWFGVAIRALRTNHWDAYLFYIRKDGRVELGIRGSVTPKPPPVPAVSSQPITIRIKVVRDRVQTWVNNRDYHNWQDKNKEFIRKGFIYLISFGALVKIYEVEIKIKKWYAPLAKLMKPFWRFIVGLGVIVGLIVGFIYLYNIIF